VNVELQTNNSSFTLALRHVTYEAEGGYNCVLEVRSGAFTGAQQFWFTTVALQDFCAALDQMDVALTGEASLHEEYEEPGFTLRMGSTGQVSVTGELVIYGEHTNRLQFGFVTDQTCLHPLRSQVRQLLAQVASPRPTIG
jgi:hypothetical protein